MATAAGVRLLVADDVWQPATLHALLRAVPDGVGTLVTSRLKFGVAHQVEVGELSPADARELLALHAAGDVAAGAAELCRDLGHHPYAVEIAGRHLKQYGATPAELREQLADTPHELAAPAGYAAAAATRRPSAPATRRPSGPASSGCSTAPAPHWRMTTPGSPCRRSARSTVDQRRCRCSPPTSVSAGAGRGPRSTTWST